MQSQHETRDSKSGIPKFKLEMLVALLRCRAETQTVTDLISIQSYRLPHGTEYFRS